MTADRAAGARRLLHKRKWLIGTLGLFAAVIFLPIIPFSPRCSARGEPFTVGDIFLAENFKAALTDSFSFWGVPYASIDKLVLLPFWTWFDDPDDLVVNASNKSVLHFIKEGYGASLASVPPRIREMVEKRRDPDGFIDLNCPLVHAVAIEGW